MQVAVKNIGAQKNIKTQICLKKEKMCENAEMECYATH